MQNKNQSLSEKFAVKGPPPMVSFMPSVAKDDTSFLNHKDMNISLLSSQRLK